MYTMYSGGCTFACDEGHVSATLRNERFCQRVVFLRVVMLSIDDAFQAQHHVKAVGGLKLAELDWLGVPVECDSSFDIFLCCFTIGANQTA